MIVVTLLCRDASLALSYPLVNNVVLQRPLGFCSLSFRGFGFMEVRGSKECSKFLT